MTLPFGRHEGNRSEYMALYALSTIGLVVPVPRQEDHFGTDFLVHLCQTIGQNFVPSGQSFGIQIKSDESDLSYTKPAQLDCLYGPNLPFLLGIVDKNVHAMSIYSTIGRFMHMWMKGPDIPVSLVPGGTIDQFHTPDFDSHQVFLGPPILKIDMAELDDPLQKKAIRDRIYKVFAYWIRSENRALSWKQQDIPLVYLPDYYQTNEVPGPGARFWEFANPKSLHKVLHSVHFPLQSLSFYLSYTLSRSQSLGIPEDAVQQLITMRQLSEEMQSGAMKLNAIFRDKLSQPQ